jgi:hypothetical protein
MSDVTTVTLEPHPAVKDVHGIKVRVIRDQHQIMLTAPGGKPTRVGYCSVASDGPIQFLHPYEPEVREFVVTEVNRLRGGETTKVFQPPEVIEMEDEPEDDTEQDDEE